MWPQLHWHCCFYIEFSKLSVFTAALCYYISRIDNWREVERRWCHVCHVNTTLSHYQTQSKTTFSSIEYQTLYIKIEHKIDLRSITWQKCIIEEFVLLYWILQTGPVWYQSESKVALTDPLYHHLAATGANCSDDKYLAPRHCYVGQYSTVQYSTVQYRVSR